MFGFIGDLFNSVVNWVTGGSGEGGAVQAITQSAIQTAVTGVVVGAATAAIRGGDVLEGALKGAAYGALAGGALRAITGYSNGEWTPASTEAGEVTLPTTTTPSTENKFGVIGDAGFGGQTAATEVTPGDEHAATPQRTPMRQTQPGRQGLFSGFLGTDEGKKMLVEAGLGAAEAYLEPDESDVARAQAERDILVLRERDRLRRGEVERNQPSATRRYEQQTANVTKVNDWWNQHVHPSLQTQRSNTAARPASQGILTA